MKKFVAMLLVFVMALSLLAGCGGNNTPSTDPQGTGDTQSTEGAIKVGMSGPLTGGAAVYGMAVKYGMEIAVEEVNALGGIQFALNCQDDEHDVEKAGNAYNVLKDWGMQILAGTVTTGPANVVAPEAYADRIFMLTPSASGATVTEGKDNVFQLCFSDPNQGTGSADYIANSEKLKNSTIGIIYDSSDAYSDGIREKFVAEAKEKGLNVVCQEAFTADNKSDLSTQVTKCKENKCDLVFMPFYAAEAALVLTYANSISYAPTFFGCDGLDGVLTQENFDPTIAEGVMLLTPFSADAEDEKTQAFVAKYKEITGEIPNQFAADAYDVIWSLYEACKAGGVTADMSAEEVCDIMIAQFTSMTFDGLTGEGMTWNEKGEVSKTPAAVVIKDGTYVGA